MADRSSDMTLAFTLAALERLAEPQAALEDARTWSQYVGAVAPTPNGALTFTRDRRIRLDFFSGTRPPAEALHAATTNYHTERYVLVALEGQEDMPPTPNWEFQTVESAAERAGWALRSPEAETGVVDRIGSALRGAIGRSE